eukprot:TRINITY_DN35052_c0_g1_i3.p1 TRINITY_DN35052_c0_g1~~TRINITY_DN35052_c0_g1_i3.p1  ORF type:complete len:180 (-),score=44.42 TRINITY_DN35052_c0_g1_i3:71-610(-)
MPPVESEDFTMRCEDLEKCKKACLEQGFTGFVLEQGLAHFDIRDRSELMSSAKCKHDMHSNDGSSASIPTLLVAPAGSRSSKDSKTVKALERNLLTCRRALEQQRMALKQANNENEEGQAAAISKELHRLKVQQVRLAAALWRAVDQEHPEPEVDLAQVDHLEAELRLVRRRIEDRRLV